MEPPAGISAENESFPAFEPATFACLVHFHEYQGNALPPKPRRQGLFQIYANFYIIKLFLN